MRQTPRLATPFFVAATVCSALLWLLSTAGVSPAVASPRGVASPASDAFKAIDQTWHDAARLRDVPVRVYLPKDAAKPAPAILVSHGLGDSRYAIAYACEAWAARGYVVVALQHPGSDNTVWQRATPANRFSVLAKAANVENFVLRCGDVKFAVDELTRRNADHEDPISGRVDLDKLGIAGHSFGALTAQGIIGERFAAQGDLPIAFGDPRIKACVLMSPGLEGAGDLQSAFADVRVPVFHFTGTVDVVPGLGITLASRRRVPFDRMAASDQYLVTYERGDHMVFSGHRPAGIDNARYDRIQSWTAKLSADFWDVYLKGDRAAGETLIADASGLGDVGRFEQRPATVTKDASAPGGQ